MAKTITCIIVGAGHRGLLYADYALIHPDRLKIVGVADPNPIRRKAAMERYGFSEDMCFESAEALAATGKRLADTVINATMDEEHIPTSVPLLKLGYDMLLEKPFAINPEEMFYFLDLAREYDNTVLICHVLRYAPFYRRIKDLIVQDKIGEVISIQMSEMVSYHHLAVSYLRGKWSNRDLCGAPILLAKTCHDIDLMLWLKGQRPAEVSSFGSDFQFAEFKKPQGTADRCLDCNIVDSCLYSAKSHYLSHPDRWTFYVWAPIEDIENPTLEDKKKSLEKDNPYGQCVWRCDHKNVDHQMTTVSFSDGSTGVLNLTGGSAKGDRYIHIIGSKGEILGNFDSGSFTLRTIVPEHPEGFEETQIRAYEVSDASGMMGEHGGGDILLVEDFVSILQGNKPSISATSLEDSILGHLTVFKAEEARKNHQVLELFSVMKAHGLLKNSDMDRAVYRKIMDAD